MITVHLFAKFRYLPYVLIFLKDSSCGPLSMTSRLAYPLPRVPAPPQRDFCRSVSLTPTFPAGPTGLGRRGEACELLIPCRGPGADLIILLLLNCHLTGENHSCPASAHPFYTPRPWSSCGKFLIKISGEKEGAGARAGFQQHRSQAEWEATDVLSNLGQVSFSSLHNTQAGSTPRSLPVLEGEHLLLRGAFPARPHLSGVGWDISRILQGAYQ